METTVTGKNQVTLPAKIVKELDLHPGVRLQWRVSKGGEIVGHRLLSRSELARKLIGRGRKYLPSGSDPVRDLIRDREAEDREEGPA